MRVRAYTRYMDDLILVHHDRAFLRECLFQMTAYAKRELRLEFNEKTQVAPLSQGIDYLGFHMHVTDDGKVVRRLRQAAKRRLKARLRALGADEADPDRALAVLASLGAHLAHGDCHGLEREVADMVDRVRPASSRCRNG